MKKTPLFFWIMLMMAMPVSALSEQDIKQAYSDSYLYEQQGRLEKSIQALVPVVAAYPLAYTVNLRLGYLNFNAKQYDKSIKFYAKASQALPASLEPKLAKMLVLIAQTRHAQAIQVGYHLLAVDPYNYYANLRLAYCLRLEKKYDVAEKIVTKMLALYPIDEAFLSEYVLLANRQGRFKQALETLSSIQILYPNNTLSKNRLLTK